MTQNTVENLIEVTLATDDDFLKVKETLTRIGVASKKENKLYQSCHILHKRGKYYIVHFKELFMLDNRPSSFSEDDRGRRNTIVILLDEWGLINIVEDSMMEFNLGPKAPISQIKILPFKEKANWELISKYTIGNKK